MASKNINPIFNRLGIPNPPKVHRNYSHRELISGIDNYASVAKTLSQQKDMLDIKDNFYKRMEDNAMHRAIRNEHFRQGIRAGIHPRETLENLEAQDMEQDQRIINGTMLEAKTYYHRNYSLSKTFNEINPHPRIRSINKEKE